jgi:hypothetical protein
MSGDGGDVNPCGARTEHVTNSRYTIWHNTSAVERRSVADQSPYYTDPYLEIYYDANGLPHQVIFFDPNTGGGMWSAGLAYDPKNRPTSPIQYITASYNGVNDEAQWAYAADQQDQTSMLNDLTSNPESGPPSPRPPTRAVCPLRSVA